MTSGTKMKQLTKIYAILSTYVREQVAAGRNATTLAADEFYVAHVAIIDLIRAGVPMRCKAGTWSRA